MTRLLLCDCGGSQTIDRDRLEAATGLQCSKVHSGLCTFQIDRAEEALKGGDVVVACAQEAETFEVLAEELGFEPPLTVDIRDRAGWSEDGADAAPKMAALLAQALHARTPARTVDVRSEGLCLIVGAAEVALPAAERLSEALSVTCILTDDAEVLPAPRRAFDVAQGRIRSAAGTFGAFRVTVDGFRAALPPGRGPMAFSAPRDGGESECDLILDLRGASPLFSAHEKRDGYLRADPGDPGAVARAVFEASHMVGTFEKVLHVRLDEALCAHSRARQTGCTRCLDLCPTGAITPNGDSVAIDPMICAGCGACSAVCPSGAVAYDAPPVADIFAEVRLLAATYRKAGGEAPRLLVHDETHGREMIALAARLGRGLPADVIPLELPAVAAFGHAEMLVALASGFSEVRLLPSPKSDRDTIGREVALAEAIVAGVGVPGNRVAALDAADPDAMSDALYAAAPAPLKAEPILALGHRRDAARLAAKALSGGTAPAPFALPEGAPYGAVLVDQEACTLCLSCTGLCPPGALLDNPDKPQLGFREDACLQCGLCVNICPENAIALEPRLDLSDAALSARVMKEEEPYECIECGKPFGVKSTVERIVAQLEGKNPMFIGSDNARLIRMCDDCRVRAQYHSEAAPFRMGDRPRIRTTDDYIDPKKKH